MITRASRISKQKQGRLLKCFCDDLTATQTASQVHISRMAVNRYFRHYRELIQAATLRQYPRFSGEVEIDIGFFGGRAAKWQTQYVQRLLGLEVSRIVARRKYVRKQLARKQPILGILQRGGGVILLPLESKARKYLEASVRLIVEQGSVVYTDMEKGLDGLKFDGYIHRQVNHSKGHVDKNGYHINGIESFWRECRRSMAKNFRGIPRSTLSLHIKEREWRFNHRGDELRSLRSLLRDASH